MKQNSWWAILKIKFRKIHRINNNTPAPSARCVSAVVRAENDLIQALYKSLSHDAQEEYLLVTF